MYAENVENMEFFQILIIDKTKYNKTLCSMHSFYVTFIIIINPKIVFRIIRILQMVINLKRFKIRRLKVFLLPF